MSSKKASTFLSYPGFLLFKGIAWLISKSPFIILWGLSDLFFILLYYVTGYRKKVVMQNLENSFPGKSREELNTLCRKFYRHLSDLFVETLKLPGLNESQFTKRCTIINPGIAAAYIREGRNLLLVTGHSGNWEWNAQILFYTFRGLDHYNGIVKPLSNPWFEQFMTKTIRQSVTHDTTVPFKQAFRTLLGQRGSTSVTYIVADQTPHSSEIHYWTRFLDQDTAFFLGTEKIARALDLPVFFMHIDKIRRGYYEITLELITAEPKLTAEFEITEKHVHLLESDIRKQPEIWLWSHRRWKYKKENFPVKRMEK